MDGLEDTLLKVFRGVRKLSPKPESEDKSTVSYTITLSKSFDAEFRSLAKHLHVGRLELLRMTIVVYSLMVGCIDWHPKGEWVFYPDEDAEDSEMVLENSLFLPVSE